MAGCVIKGPVQIDFVAGAGDAQWTGIVTAESNKEGALSGWTCGRKGRNEKRNKEKENSPKKLIFNIIIFNQSWYLHPPSGDTG